MPVEVTFVKKNKMVVAMMKGKMSNAADFSPEQYLIQSTSDRPELIVLECTGLLDIEPKAIPSMTKYLVGLRAQGSVLRIANLAPEVRRLLEEFGVLRNGEVYQDLKSALIITQKAG